ncbi:response regulator transcription factor [Rhodococcus sp. ARC_M6]|uniref:response regulator n=1 Tax=Rhodococcus sp. ARC_M6 TaxID=2928852 RepID=UPI001FB4958A|nr:response regulator transcription factor [Rhodococcus sp. ARC_M6]MCJ0906698.1 response regulator transcription factor [Rhodococcus sp. ARC_M6]
MITVLVVDDQPIVRRGLRLFLTNYEDIVVVGEADSGPNAVYQSGQINPDVILMDIRMPDGDGLTAAKIILSNRPKQKIIIITTFGHDDYLYSAIDLGVSGFILKDTGPSELAQAIYNSHKGGTSISSTLLGSLTREFGRRSAVSAESVKSTVDISIPLTVREVDIVQCLARGLSNDDISVELCIEVSTIKSHLGRISNKVGTKSRLQTAIWAYRSGLIDAHSLD